MLVCICGHLHTFILHLHTFILNAWRGVLLNILRFRISFHTPPNAQPLFQIHPAISASTLTSRPSCAHEHADLSTSMTKTSADQPPSQAPSVRPPSRAVPGRPQHRRHRHVRAPLGHRRERCPADHRRSLSRVFSGHRRARQLVLQRLAAIALILGPPSSADGGI